MLAFVVTLRFGRRYTVRASEVRCGGAGVEMWALPNSAFDGPAPQMVALFNQHDVEAIVAKEFLVSDETRDAAADAPRVVGRDADEFDDVIPF